jgi:hypothetical protein
VLVLVAGAADQPRLQSTGSVVPDRSRRSTPARNLHGRRDGGRRKSVVWTFATGP